MENRALWPGCAPDRAPRPYMEPLPCPPGQLPPVERWSAPSPRPEGPCTCGGAPAQAPMPPPTALPLDIPVHQCDTPTVGFARRRYRLGTLPCPLHLPARPISWNPFGLGRAGGGGMFRPGQLRSPIPDTPMLPCAAAFHVSRPGFLVIWPFACCARRPAVFSYLSPHAPGLLPPGLPCTASQRRGGGLPAWAGHMEGAPPGAPSPLCAGGRRHCPLCLLLLPSMAPCAQGGRYERGADDGLEGFHQAQGRR